MKGLPWKELYAGGAANDVCQRGGAGTLHGGAAAAVGCDFVGGLDRYGRNGVRGLQVEVSDRF